jgi:hypothetical protein
MALKAFFASHCKYATYGDKRNAGPMAIQMLSYGGTGIVH